MLGNFFLGLYADIVNALADSIDASWGPGFDMQPIADAMQWFGRLNAWVPLDAFGLQVGIVATIIGVFWLVKANLLVLKLVRG